MKYIALLALALGVSSCAQTGDPSAGGLFGWSDSMYQSDMAAKDQHLQNVRQDTATQRARAAGVQRQIDSQR